MSRALFAHYAGMAAHFGRTAGRTVSLALTTTAPAIAEEQTRAAYTLAVLAMHYARLARHHVPFTRSAE